MSLGALADWVIGERMVTAPGAYHRGSDAGANAAEAIYYGDAAGTPNPRRLTGRSRRTASRGAAVVAARARKPSSATSYRTLPARLRR